MALPSLKTIFTMGVIGTAITAGGCLLMPFWGAASGGYIMTAGAAATPYGALAQFHSILWTNPVTGQVGIGEGLSRIATGLLGSLKSIFALGAAGIKAAASGAPILDAVNAAGHAPLKTLF